MKVKQTKINVLSSFFVVFFAALSEMWARKSCIHNIIFSFLMHYTHIRILVQSLSLHPSLLCFSIQYPSPILTRFLFQWHRKANTTLPLSCIHTPPPQTPLAHKYPSLHPSLVLLFSLYMFLLIPLSRLILPCHRESCIHSTLSFTTHHLLHLWLKNALNKHLWEFPDNLIQTTRITFAKPCNVSLLSFFIL